MAANLSQILPFDAGANPSEAWRLWRQDFEDYLAALEYTAKTEATKLALFRHVCGEELKKQYRSLTLMPIEPANEVTLVQVLSELDNYYGGYQSEIFASYIFIEVNQEPNEKFESFYNKLRMAIIDCNYGDKEDRMLRDKIVQGLHDKPLQERLLRESRHKNLTLKDVVEACKAAELSKAQASAMNRDTKSSVDLINRGRKTNGSHGKINSKHQQIFRSQENGSKPKASQGSKQTSSHSNTCKCCGRQHEKQKCPAYGTQCSKCGFKNHWSAQCRTKSTQNTDRDRQGRRVHEVEENSKTAYLGELKTTGTTSRKVHTIEASDEDHQWYQDVHVENNRVKFKLDTGAQVNVLPQTELLKWKSKPTVRRTKQPVLDYSDNEVPIVGECMLSCATDHSSGNFRFVVTELDSTPVLSLQTCTKLGLIRRVFQVQGQSANNYHIADTPEQIIREFDDVFQGTGCLKRTVKIKLKEGSVPHISAPRKVPLALHDRVKAELEKMVTEGIIKKVDQPTDWVSNMVVVDSPKKLRICIDPRPLNAAIQRPHYPIPTAERLFTSLQGCAFFTLLDAKNAFWQLPLDEESSYLTTFTTPWGRFRFLVMPYGLNNAPEEFQRTVEEIFQEEPQANPYFDDMALGSKTLTEHCALLRRTLTIARRENLKFNPEKLQLAKSSIAYLGHVISEKGIEPDPSKVEAIKGFATPQNAEDLRRFLGMVTYQSKFTPHLSSMTHSLRQLLRKENSWLWDANTQRDFDQIKQALVKAPCLRYFDNSKPVTLSVDASRYGLGAVLLQDGAPVAYGSATLTETQQRYAQIEKELLSVVFGLEHFNYYTYGRALEVQTDHKPLLGLSTKPYDKITPRLQRMLLRLNRYDVKFTYVPGKQLITADALSRAPLPNTEFDEAPMQELTAKICLIAEASNAKWLTLKSQTETDETLQDVLYHVRNGWPGDKSEARASAKAFWHCHEELHETTDGILCRGQRLVVPKAARQDILKILHETHRGIVATKAKAREYFYWLSMNSDIEQYISTCAICQQHQRANQREPLTDRELPQRPWEKVACDFFDLQQKRYLLIVDYFSKYVEVQLMQGTTAKAVIACMKSIFARHGIPEELVSDRGPPFNSFEMRQFFDEWGIVHNPSSPHYHQSNGQVERTIQTVERSLQKAEKDGKDLNTVLLDYRITPSNGLPSPAELLMGRRLRSFLPSLPEQLQPKFDTQKAKEELDRRQEKQKNHGNKHTKPLPTLEENSPVWFRQKMNENWKRGTIIKIGPQPRTYTIRSSEGRVYTRNRVFIRPDKSEPTYADKQVETSVEVNTSSRPTIRRTTPDRNVEDFYPSMITEDHLQSKQVGAALPSSRRPTLSSESGELPPDLERQERTIPKVVTSTNVQMSRSGRIVKPPTRYQE